MDKEKYFSIIRGEKKQGKYDDRQARTLCSLTGNMKGAMGQRELKWGLLLTSISLSPDWTACPVSQDVLSFRGT